MKAALIALVLSIAGPAHLRFSVLGVPVSVPAGVLILAAEIVTAAALAWLTIRKLRRFRSAPWPRPLPTGRRALS